MTSKSLRIGYILKRVPRFINKQWWWLHYVTTLAAVRISTLDPSILYSPVFICKYRSKHVIWFKHVIWIKRIYFVNEQYVIQTSVTEKNQYQLFNVNYSKININYSMSIIQKSMSILFYFKDNVNWTVSFRRDSTIFFNSAVFEPIPSSKSTIDPITAPINYASNKTQLVCVYII